MKEKLKDTVENFNSSIEVIRKNNSITKLKSVNWELSNKIEDVEMITERIEDLLEAQGWFIEDYLIHERSHKLTKDEVITHGMKYHEHRINIKQFDELLRVYTNELSNIIEQFKKIDKKETLSESDQTTDND
ncbi:DUF1474 family protein [Staphylococcus hominis]|uniref:type II toxin-antitoxin system toxin TscT n=1 Tax=Staphylococcus hominis TaxID=1290 RepID=UPI001F585AB3|nr:DUF1474 family protein [Staphylococcus hominis]MCI2927905.1 DUF1474 family protein [Staphylococcus hominis]